MVRTHESTDDQWEQLVPLLPPQRPKTGRSAVDHRRILNGILWVIRTGAPWRDLPERYGPWPTVYSRFQRGRKAGLGSSLCRWHRCACAPARRRCKKGDPATEALGRSQGGFSTKVHIRAEGHSRLMTVALIPGQRHETTAFETLMVQGAVKCAGRGRPKLRPRRLIGDKGYSSRKMVSDLKIGARCLFSCLVVNEVHGGFSIIRGE